jgi:cell division protein ZipA
VDEASALSTAAEFIALNIYPERRVLSGEKTLKVLLKYGLRFGEMACFHRYTEDGSKLLFSVLQITDEGAAGFDLETLSTEQVKGLAFFLALPHSDVQNAFDTMDSISRLIAREIDGTVYDQNNQEFTPQLREQWRHFAIDYRAGQSTEV